MFTVALAGFGKAGGFIQLQNKNAAGVGAVHHPQLAVFIKKHVRVYCVRVDLGVIYRAVFTGLIPHAGLEHDLFVHIRAFNVVSYRYTQRRAGWIALAGVVVEVEFAIVQLDNIRGPQAGYLWPGKGVCQFGSDLIAEQGVLVVHAIGHLGPVHQVATFGGSQMRAKHIVLTAYFYHWGVVYRRVGKIDIHGFTGDCTATGHAGRAATSGHFAAAYGCHTAGGGGVVCTGWTTSTATAGSKCQRHWKGEEFCAVF